MEPIDEDAIEHAISIRLAKVSPQMFLSTLLHRFQRTIARALSARPTNVRILSVQIADDAPSSTTDKQQQHHRRHIADVQSLSSVSDLDILFTVSKGDSRGFYRPNFVRTRLEQTFAEMGGDADDDDGARFGVSSIVTEVCRRDLCVRGDCRDRLWLDDVDYMSIYANNESMIIPKHLRTFECICRDGYAGTRCNIAVDECSREPCTLAQMCVPKDDVIGYECICPPGNGGANCADRVCPNGDCNAGMWFNFV